MQLLKEVLPDLRRAAVLVDPSQGLATVVTVAAGKALGIEVRVLDTSKPEDFEPVFETAVNWVAQALSPQHGIITVNRQKFIALAENIGCRQSITKA